MKGLNFCEPRFVKTVLIYNKYLQQNICYSAHNERLSCLLQCCSFLTSSKNREIHIDAFAVMMND